MKDLKTLLMTMMMTLLIMTMTMTVMVVPVVLLVATTKDLVQEMIQEENPLHHQVQGTMITQMITGTVPIPKMVKMTPQKRKMKKQTTIVKATTQASLIVKMGHYRCPVKSLWIKRIQKDVLNVMKNSAIILMSRCTIKMFT